MIENPPPYRTSILLSFPDCSCICWPSFCHKTNGRPFAVPLLLGWKSLELEAPCVTARACKQTPARKDVFPPFGCQQTKDCWLDWAVTWAMAIPEWSDYNQSNYQNSSSLLLYFLQILPPTHDIFYCTSSKLPATLWCILSPSLIPCFATILNSISLQIVSDYIRVVLCDFQYGGGSGVVLNSDCTQLHLSTDGGLINRLLTLCVVYGSGGGVRIQGNARKK